MNGRTLWWERLFGAVFIVVLAMLFGWFDMALMILEKVVELTKARR